MAEYDLSSRSARSQCTPEAPSVQGSSLQTSLTCQVAGEGRAKIHSCHVAWCVSHLEVPVDDFALVQVVHAAGDVCSELEHLGQSLLPLLSKGYQAKACLIQKFRGLVQYGCSD